MKVAILGAVHGTSASERLIFETYKAAVSLKLEDAEIVEPNVIFSHRDEFVKNNPQATKLEATAEMVKFDLEEVKSADLVIADISLRSTGLGLELAGLMGKREGKHLLLFAKADCTFSDMIVGAFPNNQVYIYESQAELAQKLDELLN